MQGSPARRVNTSRGSGTDLRRGRKRGWKINNKKDVKRYTCGQGLGVPCGLANRKLNCEKFFSPFFSTPPRGFKGVVRVMTRTRMDSREV